VSPRPVAKPAPAKPAAARPASPFAVVAPPRGAPADGLAGAGLKLLGAPYVWGGSAPSGFDCSGFLWYVSRQIGKPLSRGLFGQYNSGSHPSRDDLKAGDLVFFQNTYSPGLSHNGIYIGNGQFVHAADEAVGVTISSLNTAFWSSHWFGATRLP
jgi:cell wall-associated NlpC family hydrolase